MKELSIYIHIPFCVKKCSYCDFLSFPADDKARAFYVETLLKEIRLEAQQYGSYQVQTVFFGGGTPSLLTVEQMKSIMDCLRENFVLAPEPEISMEANPGTVTAEKLAGFYKAGINRLSIGLQSANDAEMKELGRIHTYDMFLEAYKAAVEAGFFNINVDVMSALPGQSVESYQGTLEKVLSLNPPPKHISAYSLIVEEGTPFGARMEQGLLILPTEEEEREMYELTERMLKKAGYHRYEISNYAMEGFECRHNKTYWVRQNYLGLGLGAASLLENVRMTNESDMTQYAARIEAGVKKAAKEKEALTMQEQMEETMFLGLRLMEGVSKEEFIKNFGCPMESVYGEVIEKHVKNGLLENGQRVKLTAKGIDVSNFVMADFLL